MKVSLVSFDLSDNSLGRTYVLAKVLQRKYDVEIVGPVFGQTIWSPVNTGEFEYRSVPGLLYPAFLTSVRRMLKLITGDVVYAVKLRPSSYGITLIKMLRHRLPLVLDIDDWEVGFYRSDGVPLKPGWFARTLKSLRHPNSYPYTLMIEKLAFLADQTTVSSRFLQRKFGGTIVRHGRDTNAFDPRNYDRASLRKELGFDGVRAIMFLGTPRPHKGLEDLIEAVTSIDRPDIALVVAGAQDDIYTEQLKALGKGRLKLIGMVPFGKVPELLSAADLVVLPQRKTPSTAGQVPAKVFDAMAMGKPIVATRVSDLPEILDGCGLIVEPDDVNALSEAILCMLENEHEAQKFGSSARRKCVREYSWDAMEETLTRIFDRYA